MSLGEGARKIADLCEAMTGGGLLHTMFAIDDREIIDPIADDEVEFPPVR